MNPPSLKNSGLVLDTWMSLTKIVSRLWHACPQTLVYSLNKYVDVAAAGIAKHIHQCRLHNTFTIYTCDPIKAMNRQKT